MAQSIAKKRPGASQPRKLAPGITAWTLMRPYLPWVRRRGRSIKDKTGRAAAAPTGRLRTPCVPVPRALAGGLACVGCCWGWCQLRRNDRDPNPRKPIESTLTPWIEPCGHRSRSHDRAAVGDLVAPWMDMLELARGVMQRERESRRHDRRLLWTLAHSPEVLFLCVQHSASVPDGDRSISIAPGRRALDQGPINVDLDLSILRSHAMPCCCLLPAACAASVAYTSPSLTHDDITQTSTSHQHTTMATNGGRPQCGEYGGFATAAIHAGQEPDPATGAVVPPISLATTFSQVRPCPCPLSSVRVYACARSDGPVDQLAVPLLYITRPPPA